MVVLGNCYAHTKAGMSGNCRPAVTAAPCATTQRQAGKAPHTKRTKRTKLVMTHATTLSPIFFSAETKTSRNANEHYNNNATLDPRITTVYRIK